MHCQGIADTKQRKEQVGGQDIPQLFFYEFNVVKARVKDMVEQEARDEHKKCSTGGKHIGQGALQHSGKLPIAEDIAMPGDDEHNGNAAEVFE